ncbi:MAG: hypothetical protein GY910_13835 [bacterium]|nr:hypothetical protein [Deltaproteobacteria bacterium]MCP4906053.1 hypothetical protein [bacterium]
MSCGLRDVTNLEASGRPTVLIHTDLFGEGVAMQAERLGQPAMRRATLPHPVQDKTDDEIRGLASQTLRQILSSLTTDPQ